jgi:WD40 repeat protein
VASPNHVKAGKIGGQEVALAAAGQGGTAMTRTRVFVLTVTLSFAGAGWWLAACPAAPAVEKLGPPRSEEDRQPRLDGQGDPLPAEALARLGTLRFRHGKHINTLIFSPDGQLLATGGEDDGIQLHDVTTGKKLRTLGERRFLPGKLAFAPDGKTLAGISGGIVVWDVATGREQRRMEGAGREPETLAFSADGRRLTTAGSDGIVQVWDLTTGKERSRCQVLRENLVYLVLFPDGRTMVTSHRDKPGLLTLRRWDLARGKVLLCIEDQLNPLSELTVAPDGKTLAVSPADNTIRLWDLESGRERARLLNIEDVVSVAFARDSKTLATCCEYGPVRQWETATGKELRQFNHPGGGRCIAFAPDGGILASASLWTIELWDISTGKALRRLPGHARAPTQVALSHNGKVLASVDQETLLLWDVARRQLLGQLRVNDSKAKPAFSPDDRVLALADLYGVRLWDVRGGNEVRHLKTSWSEVAAVGFLDEGRTVVAASLNAIYYWEASTGREQLRWDPPENACFRKAVFSPDGKILASTCSFDTMIHLWDVTARKELRQIDIGPENVVALNFSPDSKTFVSSTAYGPTRVWEIATGKQVYYFGQNRGSVTALAFSADSRFLLTSLGGDTMQVREAATGDLLPELARHQDVICSAVISSDGRLLATGSQDTTVLLWDLAKLTGNRGGSKDPLTSAQLETLWTELAKTEAARGYPAVGALLAAPDQAVPFLRQRLLANSKRIARLVAELDDEQFRVRERMSEELSDMGVLAETALKKALADHPSAEVRRRAEELLERLKYLPQSREHFRALRAFMVLERAGTPEARRALETLAADTSAAEQGREAKATLGRLNRWSDPARR